MHTTIRTFVALVTATATALLITAGAASAGTKWIDHGLSNVSGVTVAAATWYR